MDWKTISGGAKEEPLYPFFEQREFGQMDKIALRFFLLDQVRKETMTTPGHDQR